MTHLQKTSRFLFVLILVSLFATWSCKPDEPDGPDPIPEQKFLPASDSDPTNPNRWVLTETVSDEFEGSALDEEKWLIQGRNGEYKSNFIGRAPSQFSTDNVRLENGKLMLETRWEPNFNFNANPDNNGVDYENITTAAVISKEQFRYGYMEIKCKAADASITSSFWTTGNQCELDVFEFIAKPAQRQKLHLEKEYKFSIHDWSPEKSGERVWGDTVQLPYRVGDDFHVYGCEWDQDNLKIYADGKVVHSITRLEMGDAWILTRPLWVWVDSETFPWHGLPSEADLPVDYEIEYIRVWQKK